MNEKKGQIPEDAQNFRAEEPSKKPPEQPTSKSAEQESIAKPENVLHEYSAEKYENHLQGIEISLQGFFTKKDGRQKLDALLAAKKSDPQVFAQERQKTIDFYSNWAINTIESQGDVRTGVLVRDPQELVDIMTRLRPYVIDRITKTIDQVIETMSQQP